MTSKTEMNDKIYYTDGSGALVPMGNVREIDGLRDDLTYKLTAKAEALSEQLRSFKAKAFSEILDFVDLSSSEYGLTPRNKKGNLTLFSYNKLIKVIVQVSEYLSFTEELQVAKQLIDECILDWASQVNDNIRVLVNDAFQVDKKGQISTGRILGLRRLKIEDEKWEKAMDAISNSIEIVGSKKYIRFYTREEADGEFKPVSLDIAGV